MIGRGTGIAQGHLETTMAEGQGEISSLIMIIHTYLYIHPTYIPYICPTYIPNIYPTNFLQY